jgi:hypothetical protein
MLTEECHLNPFLERHGIEVVDTDLGEWIVQLRGESPSHIVLPAIHIKKEEVGQFDARNLGRMAARGMMGLARTGAAGSNGSGDYAIAFSTAADVRIKPSNQNELNVPRTLKTLGNDAISPIFLAVIEATEEAIYNSLFRATTTSGRGRTVEALPLDRTVEVLRKHGLISTSR